MDLSKITARVRPRNPHEAADLGVVMARQWFRPLLLLGVLPTLPLMLILFFVFRDQSWWAALILWWIKPLWETLQLQFIAEALFNPQVQWREIMHQAPRHLRHQWLTKLLVQRWSLSRSFNMPVGELERLYGSARSRRLSTLHRDNSSTSVWLTLLGNAIEGLLVLGVFGLVWMLVPMKMEVDFQFSDWLDSPLLFPTIAWSAYGVMMLVSPFYVCSGFMLYINRRTWLEAWDIELTFRQLASKTQQGNTSASAVVALILLPLLGLLPESRAIAASELTPEQSQQQIFEILEGEAFNEMKEKSGLRWIDPEQRKQFQDDAPEDSRLEQLLKSLESWLQQSDTIAAIFDALGALPRLLEALLWGLVIALVAYLIYRFRDEIAPGWLGESRQRTAARPTHLFGLDLAQHSLPDDVLAAARTLWQQQRQRDAMGLLYRAALSQLVHRHHLPLEDHHTESECVMLCRKQMDTTRAQFFQLLTGHWITLAYAHQPPEDHHFEQICTHWPRFVAEEAKP